MTEKWNSNFIRKQIKIRYLNKGSIHTNAVFNEISSGIFNRIEKLTSRIDKNPKL